MFQYHSCIVPRCLPPSVVKGTQPVKNKLGACLLRQEVRAVNYAVLGGIPGRCPAQAERKQLICERIEADPAVPILRRVIERACRARLCTHILDRTRTRGVLDPLPIRPRPVQ